MVFELCVELRDDGLVLTRDRHDSELLAFLCCHGTELRHVHSDKLRLFLQLEYGDLELATCEFQRLCCRCTLEQVDDFSRSDLFRVEHQVDAHLCEKMLVLVCEILFVIDAGSDLLAAKLLGQHGADNVHIL